MTCSCLPGGITEQEMEELVSVFIALGHSVLATSPLKDAAAMLGDIIREINKKCNVANSNKLRPIS